MSDSNPPNNKALLAALTDTSEGVGAESAPVINPPGFSAEDVSLGPLIAASPDLGDPENMKNLYKSYAPQANYILRNGKIVHFMQHNYVTDDPEEITELDLLCKQAPQYYYVDKNQLKIDPKMLNPMEVLRAKIRAEERASILASIGRDMGNTQAGPLRGVMTSANIVGGNIASNSGPVTPGSIKVGSGATAARVS